MSTSDLSTSAKVPPALTTRRSTVGGIEHASLENGILVAGLAFSGLLGMASAFGLSPLAEGQHRDGQPDGTRGQQSYFTTAYLHRPEEIAEELVAAGLQHEATLAIEGPAWLLQDLDAQWQDAKRRATILSLVRMLEAEPSLLGASSHLLAVGRRRP